MLLKTYEYSLIILSIFSRVSAIGSDKLTLLEILGIPNSTFEIGEKIYIGEEGRTKVLSVLGKMEYAKISSSAQSEL